MNVHRHPQSVYYAVRGRNQTFHVECDVSSMSRRRVLCTSHETKIQFWPLAAYYIFHNTYTLRDLKKKVWKIVLKKKIGKKIRKKYFGKKILNQNINNKDYNNIIKCDTIFALLALLEQGQGERQK